MLLLFKRTPIMGYTDCDDASNSLVGRCRRIVNRESQNIDWGSVPCNPHAILCQASSPSPFLPFLCPSLLILPRPLLSCKPIRVCSGISFIGENGLKYSTKRRPPAKICPSYTLVSPLKPAAPHSQSLNPLPKPGMSFNGPPLLPPMRAMICQLGLHYYGLH